MKLKKKVYARNIFVGVIFSLVFGLLAFRVYWIQFVKDDELIAKAGELWERTKVIEPTRGTIYDRTGEPLAYTGKAYNVIARLKPLYKGDTEYIKDPYSMARKISPILNMSEESLADLMTRKNSSQVELRKGGWKVDETIAKKVEGMAADGIHLEETSKRYYPKGSFLAHVLGFVNYDGEAIMGIEKIYDDILKGEKGQYQFKKDGKGVILPNGLEDYKPAKDGESIYMTIDQQIQSYVEQALDEAEKNFTFEKAIVVVADPHTGQILGMGNRPNFNPNTYWDIKDYKNHAIGSVFEPGSTFKIITLAAAIEEGMYNSDEKYLSGRYTKIPGPPIKDHNNGDGWGVISFLEGVQRSSNVAFVTLGYERLGKEKMYEYIRKFGFDKETGIGLTGEAKGLLRPIEKAYPRDIASMSFGQGVAVTAMQQVAAVSAIANGGNLIQPSIVKEIRDSKTGKVIKEFQPKVVRRVVSEKTAKEVRDILETVVSSENGTGNKYYYMEDYKVAGKTGTAQKVGSDGRYMANRYVFSFIGFAPADNPKYLVCVIVDDPELPWPYIGGTIMGPVFKTVMGNSLRYAKAEPNTKNVVVDNKLNKVIVPDLAGKTITKGESMLKQYGLKSKIIGKGNRIMHQFPKSGSEVLNNSTVNIILENVNEVELPDFTGTSLREVMEFCSLVDIRVDFKGQGYVTNQSIPSLTKVKKGSTLVVSLQPHLVIEKDEGQ